MRNQRRGAALYITVLSNALLVGLLGLSALMIIRIERQTSNSNSDMVKAQLASHSAIELARLSIKNDTGWRTTYSNNTETASQAFSDGVVRWKLVDADGDLSDDADDSVDVYGIGQVGTATWVERCTLSSPGGVSQPNILANGDCESGTTNWYLGGGGSLASSTVEPHGGAACILAFGRSSPDRKPAQDLDTASFQSGTTYDVTVWVKMSVAQQVTPQLYSHSGSGWVTHVGTPTNCAPGIWTRVTSSITPTWSGGLTSMSFQITTQTADDFWFDDVNLVERVDGAAMQYVAGSRQRVAYP